MENNKSPGSDGLSVEFYNIFWKSIKTFYLDSINYSYQTGHLTTLQKQGIISLIPKPNKDLLHLSNWRPISLLNVDYKIATKAISNRIKRVLPTIINFEQTDFMKNRYIGENVRTIFDIIEYLNKNNKPGLLFFADFEKAFDSLKHDYITECLKRFNFGKDLINWTKVFYNDISSMVLNNGHLSKSFAIKKRSQTRLSFIIFLIYNVP